MRAEKDNLISNLEKAEKECMSIQEAYDTALRVYRRYMVMPEREYKKVALWVIGTAYHGSFISYPYLFLNAMKGSGKSRFLKLTAFLIGGKHTTSLTEAVAFRYGKPLCVDEAETLGRKEKAFLREILNSAYKKGVGILRAKRDDRSGAITIEEFDPYRPICLANIEGLDDVLEDRCLTIILEKSFDRTITRRIEMFELDTDCVALRNFIENARTSVGSVGNVGLHVKKTCMELVVSLNDITYTTYTTNNTNNTYNTYTNYTNNILEELTKTDIMGRDMELWLPIFIVASMVSDEVLKEMIGLSSMSSRDRAETTMIENPDVALIAHLADFIEERDPGYVPISDIVAGYMLMNPDDKWFTAEWVGRSVRRNSLATARRRLAKGVEIILDYDRIRDKARRFGVARTLKTFILPATEKDLNSSFQ